MRLTGQPAAHVRQLAPAARIQRAKQRRRDAIEAQMSETGSPDEKLPAKLTRGAAMFNTS